MVLIVYILLYSVISAWFNEKIINKKDFHLSQAILRILTFAGIIYLSTCKIIDVFFLLTVYWIVFDFALNLFRKLSLFYVGKTAKMDKFFGKYIYLVKSLILIIIIYVKIS